MAKKKKFYVVWVGAKTGIFDDWTKCQKQIAGYPAAKFKSFATKAEATQAYKDGPSKHIITKPKAAKAKKISLANANINWNSIAVDAACSGNPGLMEYQGVVTQNKDLLFHQGPFKQGTNNIGEFLGIIHALAFLQKKGKPDVAIYTDSRTAMAWVRNKKVKSTLAKNNQNKDIFDLIERGLIWLHNNSYDNPILKWDTKNWGEIPADFGRK